MADASPYDLHLRRREAILRDAPQVKALYGSDPRNLAIAALLVAAQFTLAWGLRDQRWYWLVLAAMCVGAFIDHYLNVFIHEAAHNLVLGTTPLNKAAAIFANLPGVLPGALAFRHYHLMHHRHLGTPGWDADVAPAWEARLVGNSAIGKLIWLLALPLTYVLIHPLHVKRRMALDGWFLANALAVLGASVAVTWFWGWGSLAYLTLSAYLSIGPHPTGAHILQEHIIFEGDYETASYYGPVNAISGNHGYHREHHDFLNIPGSRLPALKRLAPRHYQGLFAHRSRLATMARFVLDPRIRLDSRMTVAAPV